MHADADDGNRFNFCPALKIVKLDVVRTIVAVNGFEARIRRTIGANNHRFVMMYFIGPENPLRKREKSVSAGPSKCAGNGLE